MANHCWNYAVFHKNPEGTKKLHQRLTYLREQELKEQYTDKGLEIPEYDKAVQLVSLHALLYPKVLKQKWKDGDDAYDKFGSRWFECHWEFEEDGTLVMTGDSAWSPMLPFFRKICKHFKLEAYGNYEESGMDFAGEFEMNETGIMVHTTMTYREYQAINNPDFYWDDLINSIDDGHFDTIDDVFVELGSVGWKANEEERGEIQKAFAEYLARNEAN